MLKYKCNLNNINNNLVEEINSILFISQGGDYIYGITSYDYNLINNQTLYLCEDDCSYKPYKAEIQDVIRRGYVIYNQTYKIQDFIYNDYVYKGIIFADGYKYIADMDNQLTFSSYFLNQDSITINLSNLDYIKIPTKYYSYNSQITIGGYIYNVDFYDTQPSILLRDGVTKLNLYNYDKKDNLTIFKINKNNDYPLKVEHISFTKSYKYIIYGNGYNTENYYLYYDETKDLYYLSNGTDIINLTQNNFDPNISDNTILLDNNTYQIYDEWRNTEYGDYIHLYIDNDNYEFYSGQTIKVSTDPLNNYEFPVLIDNTNKEYVIIQGEKYFVADNVIPFIEYNGVEYELHELQYEIIDENGEYVDINQNDKKVIVTKYYITIDNNPIIFDKKSELTVCRYLESENFSNSIDTSIEYSIIYYQYVEINGEKYRVYNQLKTLVNNDPIEYKAIYYNINLPLYLSVLDVKNGNQLRCKLFTNEIDNGSFLNGIVQAHENYIFELHNPLINDTLLDNKPYNTQDYKNPTYKVFRSVSVFKIPIPLSNNASLNLHQEFNCNTQFFEVEKNKAINPIIDMEKDVYYPYYFDFKNNTFTEIQKISFLLHFRSRDLTDWKINNNIYDTDINKNEDKYTNWNILDYYNNNTENISNDKPLMDFTVYPYYQPSDLLYFLNFTDDDVFYQKDKIGKSFLRLSYYDSNDPRNQNLLCTSTVFINEGNLYQTYINNRKKNSDFIYVTNSIGKINTTNNISVNTEPIKLESDGSYQLLTNSDKRLSIQFTINNLFQSSESSEGFYMYLFKEYSSGLHEKDIYLKIEFNHAGVGRTVTFMQPYKIQDGSKEMLNFTNQDDINILKNGCTLENLYEHIYIKLHVKYDYNLKRFCYYLPEWLTKYNNNKSEMKFNLYELKLADQSIN